VTAPIAADGGRRNPRAGARWSLAWTLGAMAVVPVLAFALVAGQLVGDQEALAELEATRQVDEQLDGLEGAVQTVIRGVERELGRYVGTLPADREALADALRRLPPQMEVVVLDSAGRLVHPPPRPLQTAREAALVERVRALLEPRGALTVLALGGSLPQIAASDDRGWLTPHQHGAPSFFRWYRTGLALVGFEISGVALASELVMQLPDTPSAPSSAAPREGASRTVLVDPKNDVIYAWGAHEPRPDARPRAVRELEAPLAGWRLLLFAPDSGLAASRVLALRASLWAGVGLLAVILGGCAWLIWRARGREMRVAQQRVSFVNHVSHELKTPLTNIRMYADLLAETLTDDDGEPLDPRDPRARHLGVIVRESDRLSRLIRNVLNFARSQEDRLEVALRPGRLGDTVRATVEAHAESLRAQGFEVELVLEGDGVRSFDPDVVEQVLTNLISNVEKYARSGQFLGIRLAFADGELARVHVRDRGPGVAREHRERIFEPFWRASDRLSDGVAGTGIGLDIARRLARLHGGDLRLLPAPADGGSLFEFTLRAPTVGVAPDAPHPATTTTTTTTITTT
jgi:signal transduction histidine kinase